MSDAWPRLYKISEAWPSANNVAESKLTFIKTSEMLRSRGNLTKDMRHQYTMTYPQNSPGVYIGEQIPHTQNIYNGQEHTQGNCVHE